MEESMFGRKDDQSTKEKKLSPKDAMAQQIEAIESGKEMVFRLGQIYVKPFITVVHNPEGSKKFTVWQEAADGAGQPSGKRGKFWDTSNAKEIAAWILDREGHVYSA